MNLHDSKQYSWYRTIFCDKLEQLPQNIKLIKTSFNLKLYSVITKKHTLVLSTLTRKNIPDVIIPLIYRYNYCYFISTGVFFVSALL